MAESKAGHTKAPQKQNFTIPIVVGIAGVALGFVIGHFALAPATGNVTNLGNTSTNADNLNQVVCTYVADGQTHTITLKEAVDYAGGTTNAEGNYDVPSTETIIACARDQVVRKEAEKAGITVTDDELDTLAKETYSVGSVKEMAETFGYEENQIKEMLRNNLILQKFQERQVGETAKAPAYPETVEDESAVTKANADYIIKLAGDAWKDGKWADPNGTWAKAMEGKKFSADGADYEAALAAYQVAHSEYAEKHSDEQKVWNDYMNQIYKNATIAVGTMIQ